MLRTLTALLASVAGTLCLGAAETPSATGLRLDGTFIQLQGWMAKLSADAWTAELEAMRRARIRTIVIQWLQNNQTRCIPADAAATDPTEVILDYADSHGMEVMVGLAVDDGWWKHSTEEAYLAQAASTSIALAEEVWRRYGRHRSFAGWYLPQETWDEAYDDTQIDRLRKFFRRVSDRCKELSGDKTVAAAPFFRQNVKPDVVERTYTKLLDDAGLDVVMVQDGVGARGWEADVAGNVVPYFRAFRNACLATGTELWADVESFAIIGGDQSSTKPASFVPTDAQRLARQLAAEAPFVRRLVTFDFFHYMSPLRGPLQKRLHDDYLREFVNRGFVPKHGRSVEMDPLLPYYRDRSPASIAAEIRANGYGVVHYVVTADSTISKALLAALHRERIGVWYSTFGNGTYSTQDLPAGWQAWKMVTRTDLAGKPLQDGYTRLCLNNPDYRAWRKRQIAAMLRSYPFEGVDIMEPHWPEYPGVESPAYACFCPQCLAEFRRMFPTETALPDILNADSPRSPSKNPALWRKWLDFRRARLTDFLNDLVNGKGGIREKAPRAAVCTWTLALAGTDGLRRVLQDSGEDAAEVARTVKPDMHCFQTHWPDWCRAELRPTYVDDYGPFISQIREAAPNLPLMIQADTGSNKENRRSWDWIEAFERACAKRNVGSSTIYEYSIGRYIYTDPPRVTEVRRRGNGVELLFTKRPDPKTAADPSHYTLSPGRVAGVKVDGSVVSLSLTGVRPRDRCTLTVRNLPDATEFRFFKDLPVAALDAQTVRFRY